MRKIVKLLLVVLVLTASGLWAIRSGSNLSPTTPVQPPASQAEASHARSAPPPSLAEPVADVITDASDVGSARQPRIESIDRARRSLEIYKATTVYPPWSRPLDESTKHLLEWNKPWPVGQPFAADEERREIRVDASLDKLFANTSESFTATVTVAYEEDPHLPVTPDRIVGQVRYLDGDWKIAAEVTFSRSGDQYVARFTPSELPALAAKPREAQFLVHVQMGELFPKDLPIPFQYAAKAPFAVVGLLGDRMTTDGSLEVLLDAEVSHLAPTLIQAYLFDAEGKRGLATYSDYVRPSSVGRQQIAIKFYGKAINDSKVSGHYRIASLNGHVKVPDGDPSEIFWAYSVRLPPLVTASAYSSGQFTSDAWSSPEKDAKITQYEAVIRELREQP